MALCAGFCLFGKIFPMLSVCFSFCHNVLCKQAFCFGKRQLNSSLVLNAVVLDFRVKASLVAWSLHRTDVNGHLDEAGFSSLTSVVTLGRPGIEEQLGLTCILPLFWAIHGGQQWLSSYKIATDGTLRARLPEEKDFSVREWPKPCVT